jgi:hypothetical protein
MEIGAHPADANRTRAWHSIYRQTQATLGACVTEKRALFGARAWLDKPGRAQSRHSI